LNNHLIPAITARLSALGINAHGMAGPDGVALGTGLHYGSIASLFVFSGQIGRIYLCACQGAGYEGATDDRYVGL